jgi:hypothetical protein
MDIPTVFWAIGFPLLLFLVGTGTGVGFAVTSSDSIGFMVAKACFVAAAFDVVGFGIYWAVATRQVLPWNVAVPAITAVIAIPALVLSLQWLGNIEISLSTRLFPGNAPDPTLPVRGVEVPPDALKVFVGSNLGWTTRFPYTILKLAGEKMIEIDREKSRKELVITVLRIFDDRNNIIARVDEDGFWVENSTRHKRPNPSTLVVYDHNDIEVLRLIFLNPTTISVTGIFRHARLKNPVIVTPEYLDAGNGNRIGYSISGNNAGAAIAVGRP